MQVLAHRVQGLDSVFAPYIQNLPVGVSGIPMFFGREPLRGIEYAPVTQQVRMRCQWLLHFAREALQPLPGTPADPFFGTLVDANALGTSLLESNSAAAGRPARQTLHSAACKLWSLPAIQHITHIISCSTEVTPSWLPARLSSNSVVPIFITFTAATAAASTTDNRRWELGCV